MHAAWGKRLRRADRQREAGFTLIEVLIALFVFAIGALAIAAMTFMSIQGNSRSNRMTEANLIAQDQMEKLLGLQGMVPPLGVDPLDMLDNALAESPETVGTYTLSYVSTGNGLTADSRWLAVEVTWTDAQGEHRVRIRSLWRHL